MPVNYLRSRYLQHPHQLNIGRQCKAGRDRSACPTPAVVERYRRGLIVGIFSFVALIVGLAAAIKLSVVVADYLGKSVNISGAWLPVISFLIVFIIVVILVRLGANAIEKTVEFAMLGWVNKLG
ncbi:hypothetical protein OSTOST_11104, partial [Ostertagia ostertagi]